MNVAPTRNAAVFTFLAMMGSLVSMVGCGGSGAATNSTTKTSSTSSQQSAQLTVTPATLNIGSVGVGTSGTAIASLAATGADVTVTSASSSNSRFALSGISLPLTIPAGQSAEFTVTFSPQATGAVSGTLTFSSDATPSLITDTIAGTGTGAAAQTYTVELSWAPSTSSNVVGYNIYRSPLGSACGAYARVNSALNPSTSFGDSSVADGQTYCYVTTAVNSSNQESPFSTPVEATVPAP